MTRSPYPLGRPRSNLMWHLRSPPVLPCTATLSGFDCFGGSKHGVRNQPHQPKSSTTRQLKEKDSKTSPNSPAFHVQLHRRPRLHFPCDSDPSGSRPKRRRSEKPDSAGVLLFLDLHVDLVRRWRERFAPRPMLSTGFPILSVVWLGRGTVPASSYIVIV